ncbi:hypothetical protein TrLO_g6523 [Triparma laevis f. longispina]|uniref:Tyrosine-protein kinase ephrin type A/B receptor-like domain-containing protein n=1 Tax=Triparma laevis f. longispina TaxID=1714387 RepID=A0A9W6ZJS2_9STRA|nr:hypothetical protein TrLO_g6523 [Triparma laevis f. longispina]
MYSLGGADDCSACKVDEWSKEATTGCSPCPQYMAYNETMKKCTCLASFIFQEDNTYTCKAGEILMGTACAPCETAKWKSDIGVTSCNLCSSTPQGSTTNSLGSISNSSCICPAGKYDDLNGKCEDVKEGMNHTVAGMTLETLEIEPEYWRMNSRSADIRECPVREACVGGNGTDYCREGHDGPYCNLCFDGYAKDPFLLCQSCDTTATSLVLSILFFFVVAGLLFSVVILLKRNKTIYKRSRTASRSSSPAFTSPPPFQRWCRRCHFPRFSRRLSNQFSSSTATSSS